MDNCVLQKRCSRCKQSHLITFFYSNKSNRDGKSSECKECSREIQSERRSRLSKETKEELRFCSICKENKPFTDFWVYYLYCKKCSRIKNRIYYTENNEQERARGRISRLKNVYRISQEDYEQMILKQKGLCAICEQPPKKGTVLHIDHCHKTGIIRQLLCTHCNSAIGHAHDNPEVLRRAAEYVEKHNHSTPSNI